MAVGRGWIATKASVKAPAKGWAKAWEPREKKTVHAHSAGADNWQYKMGDLDGDDLEVIQVAREKNGALEIELRAHALNDCNLEGLIYWVDVPAALFAGGEFDGVGKDGKSGFLPPEKIDPPHLLSGKLDSLTLQTPKKAQGNSPGVKLEFDHAVNVGLQDGRKWGDSFSGAGLSA